jgi:hypothetical protein
MPDNTQHLYEKLASQSQRRQDAQQRDVFLVLAADVALSCGRADQAERLRRQLMDVSPHTLLRPFVSFAEALEAGDIREYVEDLRRQYPPETAARLLENESNDLLLPADFFESPGENHVDFPFAESAAEVFGESTPPAYTGGLADTPPAHAGGSLPAKAAVASSSSPPSAPIKPRRRSPYEDPDYGPRVPANAKPRKDFHGVWFIHLLVGLVGLLSAGILAIIFIRPFL